MRALPAQRGKGARTTAQHRDKQTWRDLTQTLDMADHLVDPHRRFIAEGRRDRVLAMGTAGDRHRGTALGQIGHRGEHRSDQAKQDPVGLAQHQQVAGLRDILRRCPPMHPPAMRLADNSAELPDQWHDGVAGAREPLVDARSVEQFQPRCTGDRVGRRLRDDAELRLRLGERDFDVEPRLPSIFLAKERANPGIGNAGGRRQFIAHEGLSTQLGNFGEILADCSGGIRHRGPWQATCRRSARGSRWVTGDFSTDIPLTLIWTLF